MRSSACDQHLTMPFFRSSDVGCVIRAKLKIGKGAGDTRLTSCRKPPRHRANSSNSASFLGVEISYVVGANDNRKTATLPEHLLHLPPLCRTRCTSTCVLLRSSQRRHASRA